MNDLNKTELGLDENLEGALAYLLGFITGFFLLLLERNNKFVKFHAIQSLGIFLPLAVLGLLFSVLSMIPYIGLVFGMLYGLLMVMDVMLWILLIVKAYQHERFKLPVIGDIAEKNSM